MRLVLTEEQITRLIESKLYYGEDQLPKLIEGIKDDIVEGVKTCSKFLGLLKSLNMGDVIDDSVRYNGYLEKMKKVHDVYYKKSNSYYDILNTFENDFDNHTLQEFDRLNSKMDTIQNDMDDIIGKYSTIIETVLEIDGSVNASYRYLSKTYPENTVKI